MKDPRAEPSNYGTFQLQPAARRRRLPLTWSWGPTGGGGRSLGVSLAPPCEGGLGIPIHSSRPYIPLASPSLFLPLGPRASPMDHPRIPVGSPRRSLWLVGWLDRSLYDWLEDCEDCGGLSKCADDCGRLWIFRCRGRGHRLGCRAWTNESGRA